MTIRALSNIRVQEALTQAFTECFSLYNTMWYNPCTTVPKVLKPASHPGCVELELE